MGAEDQAMFVAQQEMEFRVELFNRMALSCFKKCVDNRHKDGSMSIGENSCTDRCASKYWQVFSIVGQMMGGAAMGGK